MAVRTYIVTLACLATTASAQAAIAPSEVFSGPDELDVSIHGDLEGETISVESVQAGEKKTRVEIPQSLVDPSLSLPIDTQAKDIALVTKADLARLSDPGAEANAIDFVDLPDAIAETISGLTDSCTRIGVAEYCKARDRLVDMQPGLGNSSPALVQCSRAANAVHRAWQIDSRGWHATAEAQAWEDACLAPLEAPERSGTSSVDPGLLSTIGILSFHGEPFCSGLLTDTGLFVTAQHCYREGGLSVRQAGSNEIRTLSRVDTNSRPGIPNDWAVFRLTGGAPLVVQPTEFSEIGAHTVAYPVGLSLVAAWRNAPLVDITQTVRAPRDDMCKVLFEMEGCLHLACQTMQGFSGAPIFLGREAGADSPPKVVGLLSGGKLDGTCKGDTVARVTFAVPIKSVILPSQGE